MGSFTSATATVIMQAIFPASTTTLVPLSGGSAAVSAFKIYNNSDTASQIGIRAIGSNIIHTCHLVVGTTSASGNPSIGVNGLTDANFPSGTAARGGITGTTVAGGTVTYPINNTSSYVDYTGKAMVASGGTTHTWTGWTVSEASAKGQAVSALQIGFPTLGTNSTTQNVYGFVITAQGTDAATNAAGFLIAAPTTPAPLIIAYGDLSNGRQVSTGDTPVFAAGAITITLD